MRTPAAGVSIFYKDFRAPEKKQPFLLYINKIEPTPGVYCKDDIYIAEHGQYVHNPV